MIIRNTNRIQWNLLYLSYLTWKFHKRDTLIFFSIADNRHAWKPIIKLVIRNTTTFSPIVPCIISYISCKFYQNAFIPLTMMIHSERDMTPGSSADSRLAPSQWETSLKVNLLSLARHKPRINHGPLARYVKLQTLMRQECRERFPRHRG